MEGTGTQRIEMRGQPTMKDMDQEQKVEGNTACHTIEGWALQRWDQCQRQTMLTLRGKVVGSRRWWDCPQLVGTVN